MPRIKQCENEYREKDFRRYMRVRMAAMEMPQYELGEHLGVSDARVSQILNNPGRIPLERMREMITFLRIEPEAMLRFLGYTEKQIKSALPMARTEEKAI